MEEEVPKIYDELVVDAETVTTTCFIKGNEIGMAVMIMRTQNQDVT